MGLQKKQKLFIEKYLQCFNATQAAREAGYSEKTSRQIGSKLLSNVVISAEINKYLAAASITTDEVLMRLTKIARGQAPARWTSSEVFDEEGKPHKNLVEVFDPLAALNTLAKISGLYRDPDVNLWKVEVKQLIIEGAVTFDMVKAELGDDLATELFEQAGVGVANAIQ